MTHAIVNRIVRLKQKILFSEILATIRSNMLISHTYAFWMMVNSFKFYCKIIQKSNIYKFLTYLPIYFYVLKAVKQSTMFYSV